MYTVSLAWVMVDTQTQTQIYAHTHAFHHRSSPFLHPARFLRCCLPLTIHAHGHSPRTKERERDRERRKESLFERLLCCDVESGLTSLHGGTNRPVLSTCITPIASERLCDDSTHIHTHARTHRYPPTYLPSSSPVVGSLLLCLWVDVCVSWLCCLFL